jgi:hypothetical protein
VAGVASIANQVGYQPIISDYLDATSPTVMAQAWSVEQWKEYGPPGARYIIGMPILWTGTPSSWGALDPSYSVADVLAGDYDTQINAALTAIASLDPHAIVRLGWEMNGGWMPWGTSYISATQFIALFQHDAVLVHNHGLLTDWNPDIFHGWGRDVTMFYPGDSYVDVVGPDVYAQAWVPAGEVNPTEPTEWDTILTQGALFVAPGTGGNYQGLEWYVGYASLHGKPLLLPEVGLWTPTTVIPGEGGTGDDPTFIADIAAWAAANEVQIVLWAYGSEALFSSATPLATAQAVQSFGTSGSLPAPTTTTSQPAPTTTTTQPVPTTTTTQPVPTPKSAPAAPVANRHLTAQGGRIKWAVVIHNAKTCTWSSAPKVAGFDATAKCTGRRVIRSATFKANTSTEVKDYTLALTIRGTTTTVDQLEVVEAGRSVTTTTEPQVHDQSTTTMVEYSWSNDVLSVQVTVEVGNPDTAILVLG